MILLGSYKGTNIYIDTEDKELAKEAECFIAMAVVKLYEPSQTPQEEVMNFIIDNKRKTLLPRWFGFLKR